jgi:hypothetical protein
MSRPELIVVTAASSNHAGALKMMMESLARLDAEVDCYDLGLTDDERGALPHWSRARLHTFDYASYPPYMDVNVNAGEYAWKPVIVGDVIDRVRAQSRPADVLWADAGCFFHAIDRMADRIAQCEALWVRTSAGTMRQWTHPAMFAHLGVDPDAYGDKPNADATLVGFNLQNPSVYDAIVEPWRRCAMVKDCIAPSGSSRANHRQDQAVLSYLVHRAGYPFATDTAQDLGVRTKCDRWFYNYFGYHVPAGVYARTCLA